MVGGVGLLLGATAAAEAQRPYQPPAAGPWQPPYAVLPSYRPAPQYPAGYAPAPPTRPSSGVPPSWNYDPYTDGTVPTPHGGSG